MNPLSPFFAIIIFLIAFATTFLLNLNYKLVNQNARYENIDGLRGFLAIGVFIHHSSIWFQYLHINSWEAPKSNLFNQLGQTSVSFFFMITSFLFITKLLNSDIKKLDWKNLYKSRFFRLVPMYLFSILTLVSIVFITSNWKLNVGIPELLNSILSWSTFTIFGMPSINNSIYTNIINAGVVWSLPYEWLFYFSLPFIYWIVFKKMASKLYTIISALFVILFLLFNHVSIHHLLSFVGGSIAPFIIKYGSKNIKYESFKFTVVILICLFLLPLFETADNYICKLLIAIIFNLIALGNNVFGILRSATLKLLGEISYSTYLIHGIIIFITIYFIYGLENVRQLSEFNFCVLIFMLVPILIITSFLTFKYIEKPFINLSKK